MAPKPRNTANHDRRSGIARRSKRLRECNITRIATPHQHAYRGFLDLPSELRNAIYGVWAAGEAIHIRPRGADFLTTTHPIASLCRQTRDEFMSIMTHDALFTAKKVIAQVHDFNFYYVNQFKKRVASDGRAKLYDFTYDAPGGRELQIELTLTRSFSRDPPVKNFGTWFRFLHSLSAQTSVAYTFRDVAEEERALAIVKDWARGHGQHSYLGEIVGLLKDWVADAQAGAQLEDEEEDESGTQEDPEIAFLRSLM